MATSPRYAEALGRAEQLHRHQSRVIRKAYVEAYLRKGKLWSIES